MVRASWRYGCWPVSMRWAPLRNTSAWTSARLTSLRHAASVPRTGSSSVRPTSFPSPNSSFDLVVVCETLEHLAEPCAAVAELRRVCAGYFLASVPWEPAWSLANLLRGEYLNRLGSTPGHLQRFTRTAFRRLVGAWFELVAERRPLPWTILLARVPESEHAIRIPTVWKRETQFHGQTASEALPLGIP